MQWSDEGIVLSVRPHGETAAVVEIMTRHHGRHLGLVHGGRSRKLRPILQIGNHVDATWKARLAEQLGHISLELRRGYGIGMITALIRVEGRPVGVVANNPAHLSGAVDAVGSDKLARFLQLCDAHDLPVVSLCDTPGFMVGPEAEAQALAYADVDGAAGFIHLGPQGDHSLQPCFARLVAEFGFDLEEKGGPGVDEGGAAGGYTAIVVPIAHAVAAWSASDAGSAAGSVGGWAGDAGRVAELGERHRRGVARAENGGRHGERRSVIGWPGGGRNEGPGGGGGGTAQFRRSVLPGASASLRSGGARLGVKDEFGGDEVDGRKLPRQFLHCAEVDQGEDDRGVQDEGKVGGTESHGLGLCNWVACGVSG